MLFYVTYIEIEEVHYYINGELVEEDQEVMMAELATAERIAYIVRAGLPKRFHYEAFRPIEEHTWHGKFY